MPFIDPEQRKTYQREYSRRRRAGATAEKKRKTQAVRLRSAGDVQAVLERAVGEIEGLEGGEND